MKKMPVTLVGLVISVFTCVYVCAAFKYLWGRALLLLRLGSSRDMCLGQVHRAGRGLPATVPCLSRPLVPAPAAPEPDVSPWSMERDRCAVLQRQHGRLVW